MLEEGRLTDGRMDEWVSTVPKQVLQLAQCCAVLCYAVLCYHEFMLGGCTYTHRRREQGCGLNAEHIHLGCLRWLAGWLAGGGVVRCYACGWVVGCD